MNKKILTFMIFCIGLKIMAQNTNEGLKTITERKAKAYIEFLASDALKGRNAGSPEGKIAAEYIASKLKEIGIKPLLEGYFQPFEAVQNIGKKAKWQSVADSVQSIKQKAHRSLKLQNVLGYIKGKRSNEYVIIGAHFDHLGEDKSISNDGIFNGADDNASGVSAVLQIAEAMMKEKQTPERNVIFAFWDGEEKGLLGSQFFVNTFPAVSSIKSYLNFDMIGRNTNEAQPWSVVFFYTKNHPKFEEWVRTNIKQHHLNLQVDYRAWDKPYSGSDNASFALKNIPILWYHTDGHPDYHQPSDSADKINWKKLIEITKSAYLNTWKMANESTY